MGFYLYELATTDRVGILGSGAVAEDGTWHVYSGVSDGGAPEAYTNLHMYYDGAVYAGAQSDSGTYTGMTAGAAVVGPSYNNASTWPSGRFGVVIETNTAISAATMLRLSDLLRAYAGIDI